MAVSDDMRQFQMLTDSFVFRVLVAYIYVQRIRGVTHYTLYKFTTYLLTYSLTPPYLFQTFIFPVILPFQFQLQLTRKYHTTTSVRNKHSL